MGRWDRRSQQNGPASRVLSSRANCSGRSSASTAFLGKRRVFRDFNIHHIDHLCWMKNAWPVKAQAVGGRHYRQAPGGETYIDQNFDSYSVEYTFADGSKFMMEGRCIVGCNDIYSSYAHGSKGMAIVSSSGDCGMPSSIFKGQNPDRANRLWVSEVAPDQRDPYQNEWNELVSAIRNDRPYNESEAGVEASVTTSMAYGGPHRSEITFEHCSTPSTNTLRSAGQTHDGFTGVLKADANGISHPRAGIKRRSEY